MGILLLLIIAPAILFLSFCYSKTISVTIFWGIVAAVIMVFECVLAFFFAEIGSATSGNQSGYDSAIWLSVFCFGSLLVYGLIVPIKFTKSKKSSNPATLEKTKEGH